MDSSSILFSVFLVNHFYVLDKLQCFNVSFKKVCDIHLFLVYILKVPFYFSRKMNYINEFSENIYIAIDFKSNNIFRFIPTLCTDIQN